MRIFLSYAHEDREAVDGYYTRLKSRGYSPWIDFRDILPGQNWELEIQRQTRESDAVIVFLSRTAIGKTGYVQAEQTRLLEQLERRQENTIYLIPARIDECELPTRFSKLRHIDLFSEDGWERLLAALEKANESISAGAVVGQQFGPFTVRAKELKKPGRAIPVMKWD
jgi:hypothetical protein